MAKFVSGNKKQKEHAIVRYSYGTKAQREAKTARKEALIANQKRKDDTRRKLILGGLMIATATDEEFNKYVDMVKASKRPHDAKLFKKWTRLQKKE